MSNLKNKTTLLILLSVGALAGFFAFSVMSDDAYIMLRVAKNAIGSKGLVYNIDDYNIQACTSPLNLLLVLCSSWFLKFFTENHNSAVLLGAFFTNVISFTLFTTGCYSLLNHNSHLRFLPLFGTLFIVLSSLTLQTGGLETILLMGLILWGLVMLRENNVFLCSVFLSLAFLARHDAGIILFLVFAYLYYQANAQERKDIIIKFLGTSALIITPWVLFSIYYYGTSIPTTLQAKIAQGSSPYWVDSYLQGIIKWLPAFFYGSTPVAYLFLVLGLYGVYASIKNKLLNRVSLILLLTYVALHIIAYSILSIPEYHWYYVPYAIVLTIFAFIGIQSIYDNVILLKKYAVILGLTLTTLFISLLFMQGIPAEKRFLIYKEVGNYLKNNPPNVAVGLMEIGIIGFYANDVQVFDFAGIVTPSQRERLPEGKAVSWLTEEFEGKPDVVVIRGEKHPLEPDFHKQFQEYYEFEKSIKERTVYKGELQIWRAKQTNPSNL